MPASLSPELRDLLAMSLVPGLGPRLTAALLRHFGAAGAVRRAAADQLRQVPQIGAKLSEDFAAALAAIDVDAEIALLERHDTTVVALGDPGYPAALAQAPAPPPLLYVSGRLTGADARAIAIVGSRGCTTYGRRVTERLAAGLSRAGYTIVSGLPRGTGMKSRINRGALRLFTLEFTGKDAGISDTAHERRERIIDALTATPGLSNREIGRRLKVNYHLVGDVRRSMPKRSA
jgi:DNA processing protein